jgi:radical SAM protein with 4Fe4S-binding SPASM domain
MDDPQRHPLEWIDEYVAEIRAYVVVRETDSLLIKVPNEAFRMNRTGVKTLSYLLDGGSVIDLWRTAGGTDEVRAQIYDFFVALKQLLRGCYDEHAVSPAVQVKPFDIGFSPLPVLSEVAVTYRCNLACRFCYAGCTCSRGDTSAREMSVVEVKRVLDAIRHEAEVPSVSFTGGEPTLRDDLEDLVRHAHDTRGMRVNLITNGTLVDAARARSLRDAGLASAQVSLEGPDAQTHDALTGVPGSFERSVEAVRALRSCDVHTHTNTTINRANIDVIDRMPAFVRSLGLSRFSMNMVIPVGNTLAGDADVSVKYEQMPQVLEAIQEEAARANVRFMWYSPTPLCIFNPISRRLGNKGCSACDGLLSVSPAGDVLPCSSWNEPVGNLLRERFADVWESVRAKALRAKSFAPDLCGDCDDFAACQGACPLYWSHFGREELERFGARYVAATS